jgi:hypothetical protein
MARKFLVSIDLNKNELLNARIQNLGSAPSSPVSGQVYFDTSNNVMYYYNGLASPNGPWMPMSASEEVIQDVIGQTVVGGTGITATYNDSSSTETIRITDTTVDAGTYGSTTKIPTFTVNAQGQLTEASEVDLATQLDLGADNAHGGYKLDLLTDSIKFVGGEGVDTQYTVSGDLHTITISGEDATNTNKGIASFDGLDFNVVDGLVSVKNIDIDGQTTGDYVATIVGTENEITVSPNSGHNAAVTVGLPENVEIVGNLQVGGNLNVIGTVNSVNTTQINIEDNKINLNSNFTGTPTTDAGIVVERGTELDVEILWNETSDKWTLTNNGSDYHSIARKYSQTLGASATSYTISHNLGTTDVTVQIFESAIPYAQVEADVLRSSNDTVVINFASAPSAGEYRVVVVG